MNKSLTRNASANVLQVIAGALLLFTLYRYIITTIGVDQLGIWSTVLATVAASRLADLGLSAGVTRFVARDLARLEPQRAADVIDTGALTLMAILGLLLPLLYPLLANLLPHLFAAEFLPLALEILPYALMSLWLTIAASVFQGGLDGCQRMDLRASLLVAGQALLIGLAFYFVPRYGLLGLAWAQLGQGVFLIVMGRILLRRALPSLAPLPHRWRWPVLREMLGYGLNLQAATLFMLLLDPITKAMLARFGGPVAVGYFEIANRVVLTARSLIVSANQAIIPRVAELAERQAIKIPQLYCQNVRVLIFISMPVFVLIFAYADIISWILVGEYQSSFVWTLQVLTVAWLLNTLAVPAFFTNVGGGQVGWNTLTFGGMALINVVFGWLLGHRLAAEGVIVGYVFAIVTGAMLLIFIFHRLHRIAWKAWFQWDNLKLAVGCITIAIFNAFLPVDFGILSVVTRNLVTMIILAAFVWFHPISKTLWSRLPFHG